MLPSQDISFRDLQDRLEALGQERAEEGHPKYFFRGQRCHWPNSDEPSITPTLDRPEYATVKSQALGVCRNARLIGMGIEGYAIDTIEHAIGMLRHYSWPTPALDVTDDPDVALWFALNDRSHGGEAFMLVLDVGKVKAAGIQVADLWFTPMPLGSGGLKTRFLHQSGWLLLPPDWQSSQRSLFDLAQHDVFSHHYHFSFPPDYRPSLPNLTAIPEDRLSWRIQDVVRIYVEHLRAEGTPIAPKIEEMVNEIAGPRPLPEGVSLASLGTATINLPRWHALAVAQHLLRLTNANIAHADYERERTVRLAIAYVVDACREANPRPKRHDYAEVTEVERAAR